MIGIAHHSPVTISVLLARRRFMSQTINPDETSVWRHKISEFRRAPKDGRDRVLFVDRLATLQTLIKDGASFDEIKVVVYDSLDILRRVPGLTIIDADVVQLDNGTATEVLYRLLPPALNDSIAATDPGVVDGLLHINLGTPLPAMPQDSSKKKPRGRKPKVAPEPEPEPTQDPDEAVDGRAPQADIMDDPDAADDEDDESVAAMAPAPVEPAKGKGKKKKAKKKAAPVVNKRLFG